MTEEKENCSSAGEVAHEFLRKKEIVRAFSWGFLFLVGCIGLGVFWASYNYTHGYLMKTEAQFELAK